MRDRTGALAIGLLLLLCVSFTLTRQLEVDFYWHLLAGQTILDEGRVPRVDRFTFTSAGRPWVDLHWLYQALIAWLYRHAGWGGLDLLKAGLVTLGYALAVIAARRRGVPWWLLAWPGLVGLVAAQERFTLRPESVSFCLLGAILLLLGERRSHPRLLLLVPPLIALWANLHALYAAGLAALVLVAIGDLLEARRAGPGRSLPATAGEVSSPPRPRALLACTALSALASLLTPYGLAGWDLPRRLLLERVTSESLYARSIAEFQSSLGGFGPTASVRAFALLAVLVIAALIAGRRGARASDVLLIAGFLPLALWARRNIPLFALVALPAASPALHRAILRAGGRVSERWPSAARAVRGAAPCAAGLAAACALLLLVDVWSNRFYARDGTQRQFGVGEAPGIYPWRAARFVLESRLPGEVFNDMTVGGFLAWSWFPERRVFIDGRLEVHDEALFAEYLRAQLQPAWFEEVARRRGIGLVLLSHRQILEAVPLLRHLHADPGWRLVYLDLTASVFSRRGTGDGPEGTIPTVDAGDGATATRILDEARSAERAAAAGDPAPGFLRRLLPLRRIPVPEVNAGLFFGVLGLTEPAESLFRAALAKSPRDSRLHYNLGVVLQKAGRGALARQSFEAALGLDPGLAEARGAMGLLMLGEGDERGALEQWRMAERSGGSPGAAALRARAALLGRRGEIDEAIEDARRAALSDPFSPELAAELALLYQKRGLGERAEAEIRRALALDPRAAAPRVALARLRAARGDEAGAERILREAIAAAPADPGLRLALAAHLASGGRIEEALSECAAAVGAGLDPAALSGEPALRILRERPEFQRLAGGAGAPRGGKRP